MSNTFLVEHIDFDIKHDRMVTKKHIAKTLGKSIQTIDRWVKSGYFLKPFYLGSSPRWVERHFKEWLGKQTKEHCYGSSNNPAV